MHSGSWQARRWSAGRHENVAPQCLCPCSKDRARGQNHEHDRPFQSMVGREVMESTCEAKKDTKGPSGKETFPEARLKAASGGLQGGHHRRYAYVSPFRLKEWYISVE